MNLREETVRPQIVLFGDSIAEQSFFPNGWGAALTHTFSRKADVLVRGYGGYNTRWALFLLNRLFPLKCASAPSATIISFGANDSSLLESSSERRQHVSLDEYKDNLIKIITHLKEANPSMAIVLVTPTPINESSKEQDSRTNETTGKYARKCVQLAHEMNLPCIDLWSIMQQTASWQTLFFSDGSELTKQGNEVVHKEAVRALSGAGLCVENMQLDFPHFSEIDVIYPQRAFHPDFQAEPCSFNQDDEMLSSSFTQDDTIYQEPVQNDLDCYDEEFLVEMVDPYGNLEESNMGPTYEEPFLLPLPDNAFFPGPSPADFLYEGNSTGPTFETNVVDRSFESVQFFNVKRVPISFVSSNSNPISTPEQIKELPAQVGPSSSQEEPSQAGPTLINPSQETLNPKTPKKKKNRSLKKKKSSSKRKIPPKKAKKRGSKKTCLHCEVTKTPQWRIGPSGPGTLCNACGILYKKRGKLYDEYRPVGSPSFVASLHSNFQKEVVRKTVPAQPHWQPRLEPRAPMW